jgi:hypothetical protein
MDRVQMIRDLKLSEADIRRVRQELERLESKEIVKTYRKEKS